MLQQFNNAPRRRFAFLSGNGAMSDRRHAQHIHQNRLLDHRDIFLRDGSQVLTLTPIGYQKHAGRYRALVARPSGRFETITISASEALVIG